MNKRTHSSVMSLVLLALLAAAGCFAYRWRFAIADGFAVFAARLRRRLGRPVEDDFADI